MRKFLLFLVLCAMGAPYSEAVVTAEDLNFVGISFSADLSAVYGDPLLQDAVRNGQEVLIGNRVLVGSFNISDGDIVAHYTDAQYLFSNFTLYGSAQIGDGGNPDGLFSKQINGNADVQLLVGRQLALFFLGSTDNASVATSVSTAFQAGVFYMDKGVLPNWTFLSELDPFGNETTVDLVDLTNNGANVKSLAQGAHVVLGQFGPDTRPYSGGVTGINFSLATIPEPGTAALGLCGGLAFLLRRRRS